jgi:beta-lactamase regulating signal transducer with metallopeptidase domain
MISALLFFNGGLLLVAILGFNRRFLLLNSAPFLVIMFFLSLIRLVLPIDIPTSRVIRSEDVVPQITQALNAEVLWHITIKQIILLVWLSGAIAVVLRKIWLILKEYLETQKFRSIPDRHLEELSEELFGNKADVVRSPDVDLPMVTGFLKAHIFVPGLDLEDKYLKYVLLHEYQHIKGYDIVIKVFFLLLSGIFWWNPIVYLFQRELDSLLEIRCDAGVIKKLPVEEKTAYLSSILVVMRKASEKKEALRNAILEQMYSQGEKQLANASYPEDADHIEHSVRRAMRSKLVVLTDESLIHIRFEIVTNSMKNTYDHLLRGLTVFAIAVFIASYFVIFQPFYYPQELSEPVFMEGDFVFGTMYIIENPDGTYDLYDNSNYIETLSKEKLNEPPYSDYEIYQGDVE